MNRDNKYSRGVVLCPSCGEEVTFGEMGVFTVNDITIYYSKTPDRCGCPA